MPAYGALRIPQSPTRPTWVFDFRRDVTPSGSTYTGPTGKRQYLSNGLMGWAAENLLLQSNNFTMTWSAQVAGNGTAPVITAGFAMGPDGVAGAATRVQCSITSLSGGDDISAVIQNPSGATIAGTKRGRLWVKLNTGSSQQIYFRNGNGTPQVRTVTSSWQRLLQDTLPNSVDANGLQFGLRSGASGGQLTADLLVAYAQLYRIPSADEAYVPTTTAAYFAPRLDYDPLTGAPLGYLAEMSSTNQVVSSQALTGTGWSSNAMTVTDNANVAPDGTVTAATVVESATSAPHRVEYNTISEALGSVYGYSLFVKNLWGSRWIQVNFTGSFWFNFQPSTGTIGRNSGASNVIVLTLRQLPNGWWRIGARFAAASNAGTSARIYFSDADASGGAPTYVGDGTSSMAVWGVQFESAGVGVTSYIATNGAAVTRNQDVLTMPVSMMPGWDAKQGGVFATTFRLHTLVGPTPGFNQMVLYLLKTDHQNSIQLHGNEGGGGNTKVAMYSGNVQQPSLLTVGTAPAAFTRCPVAFGFGLSRAAGSKDGATVVGGNGALALPIGPVDTIDFGRYTNHGLNGTLESVAYYKGQQSDAFIQRISR